MTLSVQLMTMVAMVISGVYLGFAVETYRRLIRNIRKWPLLVYLLESIFWLSQTAILFFVLYKMNHGELRLYICLACLLGYSMYQVICKRIYQKVLESVITAAKMIIGWMIQVFNALLVQPILWLSYLLLKLLKYVWRLLWILLYYPLKLVLLLVKKILPERIYKIISKSYASCSTMVIKIAKKIQGTIRKWR